MPIGCTRACRRYARRTRPNRRGPARRWPVRFIGLAQDLRYVVRTLARQPLFALVAVLTLALGIGLNTAMFSFLNSLLLRPLPFPDAERLVRLYRTTPQNSYGAFSPADYLSLADDQDGFGRVAAYMQSNITFSEPGRSTQWLRVSANLFDVLGVAPALGRQFNADEDQRQPSRRDHQRCRVARPVRRRAGHRRPRHPRQRSAVRDRRRPAAGSRRSSAVRSGRLFQPLGIRT